MLIWIRSKKDELIYTISLILVGLGVFIALTLISPTVGIGLLVAGLIILGLGIVWNS